MAPARALSSKRSHWSPRAAARFPSCSAKPTRGSECRIEAELITADRQERRIAISFGRGHSVAQIFKANVDAMDAMDAALSHSMANYLTIGYGASRRLVNSPAPNVSFTDAFNHPRAQNVATLFSTEAPLNPLDTWAINIDYQMPKHGVDLVRQTLSELLPAIEISRIDRSTRELLFHTPDGELPLGQLSDGYQNMAGWCGDLLHRITTAHGDYRNPLASRGLLLIDEIDLHLHPVWQRQLKRFLDEKLPNFEIVATTHSPLTAQQAGDGELFVLRRPLQGGPSVLEAYPGAPDTLMVNQLLTSPAFGLDTTASAHVEDLRQEYDTLKNVPERARSTAAKRRLANVTEQLSDLPDRTAETPAEKRQVELLEKVKNALGSSAQP
jgi:hypothetical protein